MAAAALGTGFAMVRISPVRCSFPRADRFAGPVYACAQQCTYKRRSSESCSYRGVSPIWILLAYFASSSIRESGGFELHRGSYMATRANGFTIKEGLSYILAQLLAAVTGCRAPFVPGKRIGGKCMAQSLDSGFGAPQAFLIALSFIPTMLNARSSL